MAKQMDEETGSSCRTTVTIPQDDHTQLLRLAETKHVSLGWMIRDAIRLYLDQQMPLFRTKNRTGASL